MVSLKTEIALVKTFRLILPTAFLVISIWTFEIGPDGQTALLNYLGQSAKHLFFLGSLAIIAALYLFMGAYERRIFFESRQQHSKSLFMKKLDD